MLGKDAVNHALYNLAAEGSQDDQRNPRRDEARVLAFQLNHCVRQRV